ncbi:Bcr/CflA family multidrug efflux MFS transporter [Shewanella submarina]|uniref:Bcr/CflA family efflux transporter n=1 Tax=Shewanella submarina TaxID=2016376 RepID=A0ABV7GDZ8_9GAMM|nr:purine nucleoside transporter PunC [Shewanella submarina]MCL1038005.1 Bcr/CflA family multidrug efflux MFS transporter [Shewanella submarina]
MNNASTGRYFLFLFYLSLLSMLGFIATDMYLPAFKAIESSFGSSPSEVAMSLTTFLAGLACGQLVYGPLVNRIGHRNALFAGMALFCAATLVIANSDSIMMLNTARFFQALGACAAGVIWQALVVEQYNSEEAQGIFSNIMPLVALSPALAPIIGAFVQEHLGWRAIFLALTGVGILIIMLTAVLVPAPKAKSETTEVAKKAGFMDIIKNTRFLGNVIIFGACSGAFFSYLTVWPIVMEQNGYAAAEIGLSFIPQTIMFIVGGYAGKILIKKVGNEKALQALLVLFALCVAGIVTVTLLIDVATIFPLLLIFSVSAAANGAIYPIVVNNALQQFSNDAAKAAGVQNFLQISMSFGASSLVAMFAASGDKAIGWGILTCAVGVAIGYRLQSAKQRMVMPDNARAAMFCDENAQK